jgi:hypothetical protein
MGEKALTIEQRLVEWAKQPGAVVLPLEREFIEQMRDFAKLGCGYGWMQQVIEWEWQSKGLGAWGPEYFGKRIAELEKHHAQECNDVDDLIEKLGLNVEQCRTDGGWLNVPKIISKLKDDPPWTKATGVVPEDVRDARRYEWLRQYLQVQADSPDDWTCWLALECIPYRSKADSAEELLDMLMSRFPLAASPADKES